MYLLDFKTKDSGLRLFHYVYNPPDFMNADGLKIIGMTYPENIEEAKGIFSILPAYIRQLAGDAVERWFTEDTLRKAEDVVYDEDTNAFVTPDEKLLDELLNEKVSENTFIFEFEQDKPMQRST